MGKVLILFDSSSGNTKTMASLVDEGCKQVTDIEVRLLNIDEATVEDIQWCDGIAVGSPTNFGLMSWKMKKWFDEKPIDVWGTLDGKIGCAFTSSGSYGGGGEIALMSILTVLMNYGFLTFGVTDYTGERFSPHYGCVVSKEPREEKEKESARRLGRRLAEWVSVYMDGNQKMHPNNQTYDRFNDA